MDRRFFNMVFNLVDEIVLFMRIKWEEIRNARYIPFLEVECTLASYDTVQEKESLCTLLRLHC